MSAYARACGLSLLKAKTLAVGSYSLVLDGLAQEAGALMRPMIEYTELLTYFRLRPDMVDSALNNSLPKAGERAKAIGGIYKAFREHLNAHASHSAFSDFALSHLIDPATHSFKKLQHMVPSVLDRNLVDLVVQLHLLLQEAVLSLEPVAPVDLAAIVHDTDQLKARLFKVFSL